MLYELLIGLIVTIFLWDYLYKKRRNAMLKEIGITGPTELPLVGGLYHFLRQTPETIFQFLTEFTHLFGKIWRLSVLHECAVIVADAKLIEALLSSQQVITKMKVYDMLYSWLGTGLLLSSGKKWHTRRKIITPTFHFKILEQFVDVFDQQSAVMAEKLYDRADGKTVINIFPVVCSCALDIIAETAMGVKVHAQKDPNLPYVKSLTNVAEITTNRFIRPHQRFDSTMLFTAPLTHKKLKNSIQIMHNFTDKVIEERRNTLEKSIANGTYHAMSTTDDMGTKQRMALLDVLLHSTVAGAPLSNADIREEVDTFMFEGHDTTTSGISHCLYLLSRHSKIQQKVFEEIHQVIGDDKNQSITMRDLQDLKYLECVIKESLRLYPPVPLIGRYTENDVILDGKTYPANTNFVVLIYHALRDPDYFSNPNDFVPERFISDGTTGKIDPFSYVPFSAGPRNCIGQKFAMLEMKSTISKLVRHFELLPRGEEVKPLMNLILRSANGINLGLTPRQYN